MFSEELLLEIVRGTFNRSDIDVQDIAARTLGELGDKRAPTLINVLNDNDSGVRLNAAFALGKLGDKLAVLTLMEALEDNNWYMHTKISVVQALVKLNR